MKKFVIEAKNDSIPSCISFIEQELSRLHVSKDEEMYTVLSAAKVLSGLIEHSADDSSLSIVIKRFMGLASIKISCIGSEMNESEIISDLDEIDAFEFEKAIGSRIGYKRVSKRNVINIKVEVSSLKSLYLILASLVAGVIFGLVIKSVSGDVAGMISANFLVPAYTMFLNALKLIVGPLVFFSIADSIAGFSDIESLERIAVKVFIFYVFTSLIAIGVGFVVGNLFPIGDPSMQALVSDAGASIIEKAKASSLSIKDLIVGIIPADIVNPFLTSNMLQIIFLAVIIGVATFFVDKDGIFPQFIKSGNKVFSKFTAMVVSLMPIAVFCSMAKMAISINVSDLVKVLIWVPTCYMGHFAMMIVYGILLLLFSRYNPLRFYRLFMPATLAGFTTGSSNAALPVSLRQCDEALEISPKIYAFSIPMGATINMDGSCITLVITALYGARIFGIELTPSMITSLIITILFLTMGSPGVPGGNLVCCAMLLPTIGVPVEAVSLIMGLYPLVGMSQTAANVTGDAVVTTIIAKSENLIGINNSDTTAKPNSN